MNEFYNDPRFHFADHARDLLTGAAFILMAIGLVIAASSVGAEWQSGTFASLLTWEPRRQRVLAAKLVAPVLGVLALAIPLMLLLEGGGWLAADLRGTTAGADMHLFWQIASAVRQSRGPARSGDPDRWRPRRRHQAHGRRARTGRRLPHRRRDRRRHRQRLVAKPRLCSPI